MRKSVTKVTEQTLTGTSIGNWFKLLRENKYKIALRYLPRAMFISLVTGATAPFALYERIRYHRKIKRTEITKPPVFIIGHWRSGTTFLHTLMIQDKKFAYVANLHAFMPSIFISSGKIFKHVLKRMLPKKRRMDNMELGIYEPQEEEYAIANLSSYSIYHGSAFPQNLRYYSRYCALENVPPKTIARWKKVFSTFLKKMTFSSKGKQLVLKNPANTFRVKLLLEMYPNAKFIHIYRNPFEVFLSTWKMYKEMFPYFYLQEPFSEEEGQEFILGLYEEMFKKFFKEKELIPEGNLIEVRYEELLQNPVGQLQEIYSELGLEGFKEAKEEFRSYLNSVKNYKRNKHQLDEKLEMTIRERWNLTIKRWGYGRIERVAKRLEKKSKKQKKNIQQNKRKNK